ncbi:MAG: hypothetical protein QNJ77_01975 [Acidimicrobiia bacterium]|nr:hypothetical protein [Acidimicrobiia bacterium]
MNPDPRPTAQPSRLQWAAYGVVGLLVGVVAVVLWARNRGLDLTDEGFYLQLYAHPEAVPPDALVFQYHRLVTLLDGPGQFGIVGYRVMGLVALLSGAAVLAVGVYKYVAAWLPEYRSGLPPVPVGTSLILLTGLLGYAWAPLTVSYNTLAAALIQLVIGLCLLALVMAKNGSRSGVRLLGVVCGALLALLFYVKFPTVVAVAAFATGVIFVTLRRRGWALVRYLLASALATGLLLSDGTGIGLFSASDMFGTAGIMADADYGPIRLMSLYVYGFLWEVFRTVVEDPVRILALVGLFGGVLLARTFESRRRPAILVSLAGATYLVAEIPSASYLDTVSTHRAVVGVFVALGLISLCLVAIRNNALTESRAGRWSPSGVRLATLIVTLLAIPLATALGSNSPILVSAMHGGAGYGAALVLALAATGRSARDTANLRYVLALPVIALLFAAQIGEGVVVDPYRLPTSRLEQTQAVADIPRLDGILLDEVSAELIRQSHSLVEAETGFQAGDNVFAFALLPGLVYSIDATAPGALWVLPAESGDQGEVCRSMRTVPNHLAATTMVIGNDDPTAELAECMAELIPGYPDSWQEVGQVPIVAGYGAGTGSGEALRVLVPVG